MSVTVAAPQPQFETLRSKLRSHTATVGVVGLGYVGLPLALLFSERDFPLVGFDVDQKKVRALSAGLSYIQRIEPGSIRQALDRGFRPTSDLCNIADVDAVIVCVPTPLDEHREPDLSFVRNTAAAIAPHIKPGQLIVLESTTYPGTTEEVLVPILEEGNRRGLKAARGADDPSDSFYVAFSPEREDPGNTTVARHAIPKVVGGLNAAATQLAAELYGSIFERTVTVSNPATAEMTKLLENIYRCVNIALVNELKLLCLRMGLDIWEVIQAAATKPFGFQPFYPGPGLGGHCIPVDPFYLSWKAREFDFHTRFIELAGEINTAMPYHVVDSVARALNANERAMKGARVLVLGVAYKKDIDDMRESPALTIIGLLQESGATVAYNDPFFPALCRTRKHDLRLSSTPLNEVGSFDCVLIVTDHSSYDYAAIVRDARLVVDTRHATAGISSPKIVHC